MNKQWYAMKRVENAVGIDLMDEIGLWGITAADFKRELDDLDSGGDIRVSINSPGGSVFDGIAIYSLLAERRDRVTVDVYGIAASIASVIALAGRELTMREGSFFMIHDPWTLTIGDADDHRKSADILEKIGGQIQNIYAAHTAWTDEELDAAMREETWLTAEEAVEAGFAARVEGEKAAASANFAMLDRFKHPPVGQVEKTQATEPEQEASMADEKTSQEVAQAQVPETRNEAPQAKADEGVDEIRAKVSKIEEEIQKLQSISVGTKTMPQDVKSDEERAFYETLREAFANRGQFRAAADTIETGDGIGIPVPAAREILVNINRMSILRRFGAEVRGATAPTTRFTTVVDNSTPAFLAEDGDYSDTAEPILVSLDLHKIPGRVSITEEQAEDAVVTAMEIMRRHAAIHIAKTENLGFLVGGGSGSNEPDGVSEEDASVTAASATAVTFDELVELDESIDPDWRWSVGSLQEGNYVGPIYVVHSSTAEALRKLQDTNDNFFFRNHEENGMETMFGKPLVRNNNVPAMATGEKSILLFHPAAYLIGERRPNLAVQIGYNYDKHRTLMDFNVRVGGQVWDSDGVAILKMG